MSQAEDGIRDGHVTGVQTCALPISRTTPLRLIPARGERTRVMSTVAAVPGAHPRTRGTDLIRISAGANIKEIGRASCREREYILGVAVALWESVASCRMIDVAALIR